MTNNSYNKLNLIAKILRDRYNYHGVNELLKAHYSKLNSIKRDNFNRLITDAETEYADDDSTGFDY